MVHICYVGMLYVFSLICIEDDEHVDIMMKHREVGMEVDRRIAWKNVG